MNRAVYVNDTYGNVPFARRQRETSWWRVLQESGQRLS